MGTLNSKELEDIAIEHARRQGIESSKSSRMHFEAPRPGPAFNGGTYVLHIPKDPRFAPHILTLNELIMEFNHSYFPNPISVRNSPKDMAIEFDAMQFAQAFGGFYSPAEIANQIRKDIAEEDDTSLAVLGRIERIPEEFFIVKYLSEVNEPFSRVLASDEEGMSLLAEAIPKKFKHPRAKKGIRTFNLDQVSYVPYQKELGHRFDPGKTKVIILKGYQRRDRFPQDALNLRVGARQLALSPAYSGRRWGEMNISPRFNSTDLWVTLGKEIILCYALRNIPQEIHEDILKYDRDSNITEMAQVLKGK